MTVEINKQDIERENLPKATIVVSEIEILKEILIEKSVITPQELESKRSAK